MSIIVNFTLLLIGIIFVTTRFFCSLVAELKITPNLRNRNSLVHNKSKISAHETVLSISKGSGKNFNELQNRNFETVPGNRDRIAHVLTTNALSQRAKFSANTLKRVGFSRVVFVKPETIGKDEISKVWSNKNTFVKTLKMFIDDDNGGKWLYVFEDDISVVKNITMNRIFELEESSSLFFYLGICLYGNMLHRSNLKTACGRCAHAMAFTREGVHKFLQFNQRSDNGAKLQTKRVPAKEPYFDVVVEGWCKANGEFNVLDPKAIHPENGQRCGGFYQARSLFRSEISNL
jgi:hypothetical protein